MDFVIYGYMVALRDGRRTYLEYSLDEQPGESAEKILILPVPEGRRFPELRGLDPTSWSDDVANLNEGLGSHRD
jgi:hypothetical protein